jgi:hypothetical protein
VSGFYFICGLQYIPNNLCALVALWLKKFQKMEIFHLPLFFAQIVPKLQWGHLLALFVKKVSKSVQNCQKSAKNGHLLIIDF